MLSPTAAERAARGREEDDGRLKKRIAELYDESSGLWERLWGDHMHHGFYEPGATASAADHRAAQVKMIEEALGFAEITGFSSSLSLSLSLATEVNFACSTSSNFGKLVTRSGCSQFFFFFNIFWAGRPWL